MTPPPIPPRLQPPPQVSAAAAAGGEASAVAEKKRRGSSPAGGGGGGADELAAVAGLLRSIQRPLSTIGRIFSDDPAGTSLSPAPKNNNPDLPPRRPSSVGAAAGMPPKTPPPHAHAPVLPPLTPQPAGQQGHRRATSLLGVGAPGAPTAAASLLGPDGQPGGAGTGTGTGAEDAAARQASKEAEEARRIRAREESHVVETLCGMFPALDREVVIDVVRANEGRWVIPSPSLFKY
jgi:hypothetical protein